MKLPKYRALALLGLLTLAGLIAPREGAALRFLWTREGENPPNVAGDPEGPGFGKGSGAYYLFRAATSASGRAELAARIAASVVPTHRFRDEKGKSSR